MNQIKERAEEVGKGKTRVEIEREEAKKLKRLSKSQLINIIINLSRKVDELQEGGDKKKRWKFW